MKKFTLLASLLIIFCLSGQMTFGQSKSLEKFKYISPKPGSKYINPENNIAFRHGDVLELNSAKSDVISVTGSIKGEITGSLKLSKDHRTLIFVPDQPFALNEEINVVLSKGVKTVSDVEMDGIEFSFLTKEKDNTQMLIDFYQRNAKELIDQVSTTGNAENYNSNNLENKNTDDYPPDFPGFYVTEYDNPAPGDLFFTPFRFTGTGVIPGYYIISDSYGTPVFYRKSSSPMSIDLKTITDNRLAFADGDMFNPINNSYIIMDSHFNHIDSLYMGNGYFVDNHDMLMLENGNYFLMAYDPQPVGMDTVVPGGSPTATVTGFVVQELDADDNVIFQWRSWDYYEITDDLHSDLTAEQIDYVHGNAFELDTDDNLMMSQRTMDEITKIDRVTGDIIWRFGLHALNNMFTFTNDTIGFSHQHDIRRLANGNISVYDNGNFHMPPFSQSVEYTLDEENFEATLAWNYINDPVIFSMATGSNRRLSNNNVLTGWGFSFSVASTEVTPMKEKTWEMNTTGGNVNYRVIKEQWVTDYFEISTDTIDYGEFEGYTPIPSIIVLTNNNDEDIVITSTLNQTSSYSVITPLPLTIPANGNANMIVNFFPTQQGHIDDILTIRSESMFNDSLPQMIARQVFLTGYVVDNLPPEVIIIPSNSAIAIPQEQIVSITFNEPVVRADGSTLKTDEISEIIEFKETNATGEDVGYTAFIDAWKKVITIMPDTLKPLQTYYLELKASSVADNSENVLTEATVSTFTTVEEQGIIELSTENFAKVYPNPNNGLINIEFQNTDSKDIQIYDMKGNIVYEMSKVKQPILELSLQALPNGVYIIKIQNLVNNKVIDLKTLKN